VRLRIEYELDRAGDVVFGIGIRNDRGDDVLTSHSCDVDGTSDGAGRTQGTATVEVGQPWLRPGRYYVEVALLSGMQLIDHVPEAAVLLIEEQSVAGAPPLALKKGSVAPVWRWRVD
jgi:hypothetical protein